MNWCWLVGHKYRVYAKPKEDWAVGIRWLTCTRCYRHFALNTRVKALIPMDFEIQDMHDWEFLGKNREEHDAPMEAQTKSS